MGKAKDDAEFEADVDLPDGDLPDGLPDDDAELPDEADCLVCAEWAPADRVGLRHGLRTVPLRELDQICPSCLEAFWLNCMAPAIRWHH